MGSVMRAALAVAFVAASMACADGAEDGPGAAPRKVRLLPFDGMGLAGLDAVLGSARQIAAATLAASIRDGIAAARREGLSPLPPGIRTRMESTFAPDLLARVRWSAGPVAAGVQALAIGSGRADAVTLGHVIVFRDADDLGDLRLVAHELAHVRQYERWGIDGFARRYATDHRAVELEAERAASDWTKADRAGRRPVMRPSGG